MGESYPHFVFNLWITSIKKMYIQEIELKNFRNYEHIKIDLSKNINVFFGDNAQGKTNILESIFMSSIGKSFRAKKDKELIKIGEKESNISIKYQKKDRTGKVKIEIADKKQVFINGIKIKKLSELLGNIHIVIFTPDDINILKNGPSARRKFLDIMIGQLRPTYIYYLNLYNKTLEQKNNLLKQCKEQKCQDEMLDIWDEKLAEYAEKIYKYRNEFILKIKEKIKKIHEDITEGKEEIKIHYFSDCEKDFITKLKNNRKIDIEKGYTSKGIHKDDFIVFINGKQVNIYGSQGQHRTAVLSLKVAELQVAQEEMGEKPILLLDDFMSELDSKRRNNFLKNIEEMQVIITCTDKIEIPKEKYEIFKVKQGEIIKDKTDRNICQN